MLLALYTHVARSVGSIPKCKHSLALAIYGCKNLAWRLTPETTFNLGNNCTSYALEEINEISRHVIVINNIKLKVTL